MESAKKNSIFDRWSQILMLVGLLATPLLFWPAFGLSLEVAKKILLAGTVALALVFWLVARLRTKSLAVPRTALWGAAGLFCLTALISGLLSGGTGSSILGLGVESGTVFSLLIFFGLTFLATEYSVSKQKFLKIYIGIFSIFAAAFLFQVSRYLFGNYLPWDAFNQGATNLIGKWNDLGVFAGLIALSSTIVLEHFPLKQAKGLRLFIWLSLAGSALTLALVNFYQLWAVLAVFFLVVYLLDLTVLTRGKKVRLSLGLFVLCLVFLTLGSPLSYDAQGKMHEGPVAKGVRLVSEKLSISSLEVRPSWRGTTAVATAAIKHNPVFGAGPNHFQNVWLLNKPAGVNDSQFWNLEPEFGVGFVPTFFATTGLLGGLALLAFVLILIYSGFKALFDPKTEAMDKYFLLLAFIGAVYSWILLSIYVSQTSMLAIAFALTGLFIARLVDVGQIKMLVQPLSGGPKVKFISAVSSISAGVLLVLLAYAWLAAVGAIYYVQAAAMATGKSENDQALKFMNRALRLNPQDLYYRTAAQVNVNQMGVLLAKKMPQEQMMTEYSKIFALAKGNVDAAVTANPQSYANYVSRGSLYENIMSLGVKGAYDLAKKNYADALAINPAGPDMNLNLARLEAENGNVSGAEKLLEASLKQKKDYLNAIFMQSQLYAERGYLSSAVTRLEYAAQLAPNDAGVQFQLGYLKYRNGDYRGAAGALQSAVTLVPNYANALYFLGLSQSKLGENAKALQTFNAIAQSNPDNVEVTKIIANLQAGRDALAGADAAQIKEASPAKK
jgi:tetratricopeptide (TPR) repeat protein